jgi:hypothetical protein
MDDLEALKARLDAVNNVALRRAERKALTAVGDKYLLAIGVRAPVKAKDEKGGDLAPGALREGFRAHVHVPTDARPSEVPRVIVAPTPEVYYVARFVEDGHALVKKGREIGHVPAYPFVRPAADAAEEEAMEIYTSTMTEAIQEAMNA